VTWTLSGSDSATFSISASGVLTTTSKDFEAPTDTGGDNVYQVVINALDSGALTTSQTLSVTVTNLNESPVIQSLTLATTPYKGISVTITISVNTPGKVRFFANDKRIPNCLLRNTSGGYGAATATCTWKPTSRGNVTLTATVTPADATFSNRTSSGLQTYVLNKSTRR
jgi:hypothetical protein